MEHHRYMFKIASHKSKMLKFDIILFDSMYFYWFSYSDNKNYGYITNGVYSTQLDKPLIIANSVEEAASFCIKYMNRNV